MTGSDPDQTRTIRNGLAIGIATGAYGLSFGALAVAAGLSVPQTSALSLLMFTGASQYAFTGVIASGGNPFAAVATATLLGVRNGLYGLHLSHVLGVRGIRRAVAAQLVIDESAALSVGGRTTALARLGFWAGGLSVFVCWNVATVIGALGAQLLSDPKVLGLDVAAPAAFLALLAPRLRSNRAWLAGAIGAVAALLAVPVTPPGIPVLVAAAAVVPLVLGPSEKDRPSETVQEAV